MSDPFSDTLLFKSVMYLKFEKKNQGSDISIYVSGEMISKPKTNA